MKKLKISLFFQLLFVFYSNLYSQNDIEIDPLSFCSLYLETIQGDQKIARATGFIIEKDSTNYLITNWHVVSGISSQNGDTLNADKRIPHEIIIYHHSKQLGYWIPKKEELYTTLGKKKWIEHINGKKVDVIALPLSNITPDIKIYPLDLKLANTDMIPEVAMNVSIIGYPGGLEGSKNFPIWKTGHIASEPLLNFNGNPIFLIDATTRGGMSGSPVVFRLLSGYKTKSGVRAGGRFHYQTLLLGIYSAQFPYPEIGVVWKPVVINEILNNQ